jgi:hypothetical protein
MDRVATPLASIITLFIVVFFVGFLAVKQFLVFRQQVYQDAYYGIEN